MKANDGKRTTAGFTLLELVIVVMLIGVLISVAAPRLLPAIAYSELEGAARHLANYGRSVMAEAALSHENFTVHVKLDARADEPQQYWCMKWPEITGHTGLSEDKDEKDKKQQALQIVEQVMQSPNDPMLQEEAMKKLEQLGQKQDEILALAVQEKFDRMSRMSLMARARNVHHDSIMDEFGPLFEKEFTLDDEEEQKEEEVKDDLLARTRIVPGVMIESMEVGDTTHSRGEVEVDVSPIGMSERVRFFLRREDERDYLTVVWDPITGDAQVFDGKVEDE